MKLRLQATIAALPFIALACSESGGDDAATSDPNGIQNSQKLQILSQPEVAPPVEANTPDSFKSGFSLAKLALTNPGSFQKSVALVKQLRLASGDECKNTYTVGSVQYKACVVAADVKDRFFSGIGPADIAKLTTLVDQRLEDAFRNSSWSYLPCFDEKNTAGGTYKTVEGQTVTEHTYPKFNLVEIGSTHTFSDGTSLDTGLTAYLSCYQSLGKSPDGNSSWLAFGRKNDDYYILDAQSGGIGALSKLSKNGDVELYFSVGNKPTTMPSTWSEEASNADSSSTGLIHLKSFAETGNLELTLTGYGLADTGCATHLVTNGKTLYLHINANEYGACTATDTGIGASSKKNTTRSYDATVADLEYCLDVSSPTKVVAYETLDACTDSGLTKSNFKLTPLTRNVIKGYHALYMYSSDPKDSIAEVQYVQVDPASPEGEAVTNLPLAIVSEENNVVKTSCANAATDTKTVKLAYSLSIKSEIDALVESVFKASNTDPEFTEEMFRETHLKSLQGATGAEAAVLKYTVAGSAGGVKWADFNLATTIKIDGTTVATSNYEETTDHSVGSQPIEVKLDLANVTAASTIDISATGTLSLGCTNQSTATAGTASLRLSYPRLSYKTVPPEGE